MRLNSLTLLQARWHVFDMLEDEFEEAPHLLNDRESLTAASTVNAVVDFVVEDACTSSGLFLGRDGSSVASDGL